MDLGTIRALGNAMAKVSKYLLALVAVLMWLHADAFVTSVE